MENQNLSYAKIQSRVRLTLTAWVSGIFSGLSTPFSPLSLFKSTISEPHSDPSSRVFWNINLLKINEKPTVTLDKIYCLEILWQLTPCEISVVTR